MSKRLIFLILPALLLLNGCVIVGGESHSAWNWDSDEDNSSWEQRQKDNQQAITLLNIGASRSSIIEKMGQPDLSESFSHQGKIYQLYFYRTQRNKGDGKTTKDETTALIFTDGHLTGWGDQALEQVMNF